MPSTAVEAVYQPRGAIKDAFRCHDPEVLVDGPAGTGKSFGMLWLLHIRALKYPGSRHVILRKWRTSLTQSALVTWEKGVQPKQVGVKFSHQDQEYRYRNGSVVVIGGLDKSQKVMSTEYDTAYVQEVTELEEQEWEDVSSRLRYGVMPYQQLTGDCNPSTDRHWLKQRWERGVITRIKSEHTDNPTLWDAEQQVWTERGVAYIDRLEKLTGVRYKRLRWGLWVSAEGMVYEDVWNASVHVVPRVRIPREWPRYWGIDFGYTHPFVCSFYAMDPDGRLIRYREFYKTQGLVEDHARAIIDLCQREHEPIPRAIICDWDAEDRMTLERHLIWPGTEQHLKTTNAYKGIGQGIQAVASRLRVAGDGKPRLMFMVGSLVKADPELLDQHLPLCTEEEIEGYVWDTSNGRAKGEEPVDRDNHGMDVMRYVVAHVDSVGKRRTRFRSGSAGGATGAYIWRPR